MAQMQQPLPPHMQSFIAGPMPFEKNPLSEPSHNLRGRGMSGQAVDIAAAGGEDFRNPDVQYNRYKQLMANQFYNNNANSAAYNTQLPHTNYSPPAPFAY